MKLTLPLPPNLANGRMHWRKKHEARQAYMARCYDWQLLYNYQPPAAPMAHVKVHVTLYVHQPMDHDNAVARCKWTLDWLREDGWIVDDSPKHLEWEGMPAQVVDRKRPRIEIKLAPLAPLEEVET